jgi:hypothetical protein
MSTAWVAASVRARALARRRLGAAGARALATAASLPEAIATLADTPYSHDVHAADDLTAAQRGVAASLLWHLRVLGGWVPRSGTPALRALAAGFEVANLDEHLRSLRGDPAEPTFRLGSFATAWPRLVRTTSTREVREVLSTSAWGDPGGEGVRTIRLAVRLAWAARVAMVVPTAADWAAGAAALLVARERFVAGRTLPDDVVRLGEPLLGTHWTVVHSLADLAEALPPEAAWAVAEAPETSGLWRAEAAWWRRVERDGFALLHGSSFDLDPLLGALAVLAVDAWRTRAALEVSAAGPHALELFDAVA